ncbi:OmpA family protein [Flavisphingomonas formosensis]|uniref:OmpA family protein n=1 Tax=Flavisphingomonas formosensis TaxID=861534 RepID=UPI0012FA3241|nr:OmpA family protein [Sphingomonas formosensis]
MARLYAPVQFTAAGLVLLTGCNGPSQPRSLKEADSRMTVRVDVPESRMTLVDGPGDGAGAEPESRFAPAGEQTIFREAEIAPDRLAETRSLLTDLAARQGPDKSIRFDLPADILFDFDKATLRPDATASLEKAARLIASYPDAPLSVAGHTDAKGDDAYNDALSNRRATAVAAWLRDRTGRAVAARGYGEREPVAPNSRPDGSDDPDGRQRNRRVEIIIQPERN